MPVGALRSSPPRLSDPHTMMVLSDLIAANAFAFVKMVTSPLSFGALLASPCELGVAFLTSGRGGSRCEGKSSRQKAMQQQEHKIYKINVKNFSSPSRLFSFNLITES